MWAEKLADFEKFSNSWHGAFVLILVSFCCPPRKKEGKGSIAGCSTTSRAGCCGLLLKSTDSTAITISASMYPSVKWGQQPWTPTLQLERCGMSRCDRGHAVPATWCGRATRRSTKNLGETGLLRACLMGHSLSQVGCSGEHAGLWRKGPTALPTRLGATPQLHQGQPPLWIFSSLGY